MYDKKMQFIYDFIDTLLSFIRMVLLTHFRRTYKIVKEHNDCIILGNGPSLKQSMADCQKEWGKYDFLAVNFMVLSSQYEEYKPQIYVLCDPAFWFAKGTESVREKVQNAYLAMLQKTDWSLQLYIPHQAKQAITTILAPNKRISVHFYNKTKFEGYLWLRYKIFNRQWGMVRAQNVLNAALMLAIYSDYKTILLMGADMDFMKDLWVDEQNRVRIHDTHFYDDQVKHEDQILQMRMSEQCAACYCAFKSYEDISDYARYREVEIYNKNPRSFIDAFEKQIT